MRVRNMDVGAIFARVASFSARRATLVLAVAGVLTLAGVALALMLDPGRTSTAAGDGGGDTAAATKDLRSKFGGDPIVVLVRGRLTGMLLTEDVARMLALEGCISGNLPRGARPAAPACAKFARDKPVQVVYGPGTFINEAANQVLDRIKFDRGREAAEADRAAREARRVGRRRGLSAAQQEQFAQEARRIVTARYAQRALELAVRFGLNSVPAINNPEFVLQLVFEPSLGAEVPKPRFAYLFPHSDAAVIQARLRPGLSADERAEAVDQVRAAVGAKPFDLKFGSYVVSGSPVVAEGAADGLSDAAPALIVAVVVLVAAALLLTSRLRPVLLPLLLGAAATAITLGGVSLVGGSFSPGVAAALPLLGALAVAWALALLDPLGDETRIRAAGPGLALAGAAAALSFAALLLSPVSHTRSLGAVVAIGLVVAFALALTAGPAFLARREAMARRFAPLARVAPDPRRFRPGSRRIHLPGRLRVPHRVAGAGRSAAESIAAVPGSVRRGWNTAIRTARARPGRVLRIALVVAAAGFVAGTQIDVTADQQRLLPSDSLESRDLASIERETGTPGDVNLVVRSRRLLDPGVVAWMSSYQRRVLRQNGFREGRPCREADLCPALSLTNLFGAGRQSARQIKAAVDAMPRYFSQNVITPDRRTANIAFRMGAMPPEERRAVIERLRDELDPPAGVEADLAGPVVAVADGETDIRSSMLIVSMAALLLVAALLALAARSVEAALTVTIPLTLAVGWAFLIAYLLPIDVDFLTAALGAIVVAVSAGPAVLASRRYGDGEAGARHVVAFGAVTFAGFLALTVCDVPSLRDLGVAGAVSVPVCGLGLALTLPATALWIDRRGGLRVPRSRSELAAAGRSLAGSLRAAVRSVAGGARRGAGAARRGAAAAGRAVPRPGRNSP